MPDLLIETGSALGGSAMFYGHVFDALGRGRVLSIDIEKRHELEHPRARFLVGSSVGDEVLAEVRREVLDAGVIMVVLDSDHSESHVRAELDAYSGLVTPGSAS